MAGLINERMGCDSQARHLPTIRLLHRLLTHYSKALGHRHAIHHEALIRYWCPLLANNVPMVLPHRNIMVSFKLCGFGEGTILFLLLEEDQLSGAMQEYLEFYKSLVSGC